MKAEFRELLLQVERSSRNGETVQEGGERSFARLSIGELIKLIYSESYPDRLSARNQIGKLYYENRNRVLSELMEWLRPSIPEPEMPFPEPPFSLDQIVNYVQGGNSETWLRWGFLIVHLRSVDDVLELMNHLSNSDR